MPLSRIVFHCKDPDLFDLFVRGLARQVLVDPLRNDKALRTRHFRGYRISKSRPDVVALSNAYYKEINEYRNRDFMDYLCRKWVLAHAELATSTLEHLGISNIDLHQSNEWLGRAHRALEEKGHLEAAGEITRVLAFDHPVEDILTVLSILSITFAPQPELRQHIEQEFRAVHDDPAHLHAALVEQQARLKRELAALEEQLGDENSRCETELNQLANDTTKLTKKRDALERQRDARDQALQQSKRQLQEAQTRHEGAQSSMQDWKSKHTKVETSMAAIQQKSKQRGVTRDGLVAKLDKQIESLGLEVSAIAERLDAAEKRMAHPAGSVDPTTSSQDGQTAGGAETWELQDILDFASRPGFRASPVTLDILWRFLEGRVPETDVPSVPGDCVSSPVIAATYYAHAAVHGSRPWTGDNLGRYALARGLEQDGKDVQSTEVIADLLVGGLHHAERMVESELVDQLLARLIEVVVEDRRRSGGRLDLEKNIEFLRDYLDDVSASRRVGALQAKLATANPRALRRLYDVMSPDIRIPAKRALVSQVRSLGLQDTDSTHEILDLVTTHLGSLVGRLPSGDQTWGDQATLRAEVQGARQSLLQSVAKLRHAFSPATNSRLTQFRDLLGPQLTEVLANDTLDGYEVFRRLLLEYCRGDCRQPEWVSGRYLFPIVISLSHVALRADHAIRRRKAEIIIGLEKQQHPLSTVRRGVPLNIAVENTGVATATEVIIEIETDSKEVAVRPHRHTVHKIAPKQRLWHKVDMDIGSPVSAVELSCLFHWKDPSGVQRLGEDTLKLTAQREIKWEEAQVNPYSLGSIKSHERLVGRADDLETLRIGIQGAQSFFITGQKRVGKTSVAKVLLREFEDSEKHLAVYLTFGDLATTSWLALVYSLYEAINHELEEVTGNRRADLVPVEEFAAKQSIQNRVFLRDLGRQLGDRQVVCIIDDFDEVDERMYKGGEAKELFLRLRTLIDRGDFSFVFVGSERLPDILRHQGERLNQVQQHSLNYFRDRSSLQQLAAVPSRPYLEYSEEAIDGIWRYSAGNPYYATQICGRLYSDMVGRRDHYVGGSDVERSVEAICTDSSVSTFQHFWTDGIFEGGLDTVRLQYLNATILMACARHCRGEEENDVEVTGVMADPSLASYDPAQVQFRLDNLVDRGVLSQIEARVGLRVPLFERWLLMGGEGAVRSSFGEEDLQARLTPTTSGPGSREVVEVARDLNYQGLPVSEDRVRAWLEQFGPAENQSLALRLLQRVKEKGYYNEAAVRSRCKSLHRMILDELSSEERFAKVVQRGRVTNVFVAHFQAKGRSGARFLNDYRNANGLASTRTGSVGDAVQFVAEQRKRKRECGVVFVDDFIGTGGSCVGGLGEFREAVERLEEGERLLSRVVVGVAAIVGFKTGVESVRANDHVACQVVTSEELGPEDMAFAEDAGIFESEEERVAAERLCRNIGEKLEPKQALGYGGSQALVCFHYRCPNNTLPVFYRDDVVYQGQKWIALFPR